VSLCSDLVLDMKRIKDWRIDLEDWVWVLSRSAWRSDGLVDDLVSSTWAENVIALPRSHILFRKRRSMRTTTGTARSNWTPSHHWDSNHSELHSINIL